MKAGLPTSSDSRVAYLASRRQQRATKVRQSFDDVIAAMDAHGHEGRIEASPSGVRHWTTEEWQRERERRDIEEQVNQFNMTGGF